MPFLAAIALLGLVFEDDNLRAFGVIGHRSQYPGPFDRRLSYVHLSAIGHQQHPVQLYLLSHLEVQFFDLYSLACADSLLLSACLNHSVHLLASQYDLCHSATVIILAFDLFVKDIN